MTALAAADLTHRGLAVFPLPAGGRTPDGPWRSRCLTTPQQVRELWPDDANVGVACRQSSMVGLDLDVGAHGGGQQVLDELAARLGEPWPATFAVSTPSGGQHLYYRVPGDCTITSSSGGTTALGPGIDVRGPGRRSGGYLIGPGSVVGGIPYRITHDVPLAPLPTWIASRLAPISMKEMP
ncbi:bifunctional DNA primase/polymerase [Streptomyces sp. Da 82-17]|uniref:bifunctional DNA primase/polymerase n=1 Tax=Streptomyces sp. Da 82-17 TaxID=3377116 RepID=UPI0038D4A9C5